MSFELNSELSTSNYPKGTYERSCQVAVDWSLSGGNWDPDPPLHSRLVRPGHWTRRDCAWPLHSYRVVDTANGFVATCRGELRYFHCQNADRHGDHRAEDFL